MGMEHAYTYAAAALIDHPEEATQHKRILEGKRNEE